MHYTSSSYRENTFLLVGTSFTVFSIIIASKQTQTLLLTFLNFSNYICSMRSSIFIHFLGPGCGGVKLTDFFFREQVSQWLIDQEEIYRFQVMLADPTDTEWTRICVRHADCILVVADAATIDCGPSIVESKLLFVRHTEEKQQQQKQQPNQQQQQQQQQQHPRWVSGFRRNGLDNNKLSSRGTVYTRQQSRKELVLLHRGDPVSMRRPENTRRWYV